MIVQNPELLNRIAEWRRKATDGTISLEEMREAIKVLRENRISATAEAAKPKSSRGKKAPVTPVDAGDLLDQLKGL